MHGMNFWGVVVFSVYEGVNLVGQGRVAHVRRGRGGG